jgi:hypothetical protein
MPTRTAGGWARSCRSIDFSGPNNRDRWDRTRIVYASLKDDGIYAPPFPNFQIGMPGFFACKTLDLDRRGVRHGYIEMHYQDRIKKRHVAMTARSSPYKPLPRMSTG